MHNKEKQRGFITLATGSKEYYQLAFNLLKSYRYFCSNPLPFAILCEEENQYTVDFDDVIVMKSGASRSYLDKLSLAEYVPYEETIFIDADCLAFDDLNQIFDCFKTADDFSCFGRVLPLDDCTGWFEYKNLGEYKEKVSYVVGLHGGIYYIRKKPKALQVMSDAKLLVEKYDQFHFKGEFNNPGDEPLVALSMAINNCRPVPPSQEIFCCFWVFTDQLELDITEGKADLLKGKQSHTYLIHWGTRYTRELEYQKQVALLNLIMTGEKNNKKVQECKKYYDDKIKKEKRKEQVRRNLGRLKRIFKTI